MILRPHYLNILRTYRDVQLVKILAGIRRCGKFTILEMYQGIKEKMTDNARYYLLLDEVQEVDGWEKAVNSLLEDANTHTYVTGSNSKLMSSEISTYLTGRYISIPVYTLSYAEYIEFKKDSKHADGVQLS